jgi:hypothetical protein
MMRTNWKTSRGRRASRPGTAVLSRGSFQRLLSRARGKLAREDGQAIIFVAIAMAMILAVALLVVDGARAFTLHTETQNAADEVALAAAQDLDARGHCVTSCQTTLNRYAQANGVSATIVQCDATHLTNCYVAPYASQVGEIEVRLKNTGSTFFGGAVAGLLGGAVPNIAASARAVARALVIDIPPSVSGDYIYSDQNITVDTGASIEEPLLAGQDILLSGNTSVVWPDARIVSAGGNIVAANATIGAGTGNTAEPVTSLSRALPAVPATTTLSAATGNTTTTITVASGANIQNNDFIQIDSEELQVTAGGGTTTLTVTRGSNATTKATHANNATVTDLTFVLASPALFLPALGGNLKIDPAGDGTCNASPCEYVQYDGMSGPPFAATTRGYGGFGAPPPVAHSSGAVVDGRVAQLWVRGGCGDPPASPPSFINCQQAGALGHQLNIYAGPTIMNCAYPADPTQGCSSQPFVPPAADAQAAYDNAAVGGANWANTTCTAPGGKFAPSFDDDNTINHSLATQILTPLNGGKDTSYTCIGTAPDGSTGELAWNSSTSTLTAHGLIFFDGDISFNNPLTYDTRSDVNYNHDHPGATIWTSGTVSNQTSAICAITLPAGGCNATGVSGQQWDPQTNVLGIVAAGTTSCDATTPGCGAHTIFVKADFQGAIYTTGQFTNTTGFVEQGLLIAQNVDVHAGEGNPVPDVTTLPGGFPGVQEVIKSSLVE